VDEQERVVGRRKADSAPLDIGGGEGAPLDSHKEKSSVTMADGTEVEMLRRSFPYADEREAGLLFVCFVRDPAQYEAVKNQMVSPATNGRHVGKDAIERFYTAVAGGYYFVPPLSDRDGYIGDFFFA